MELMGPEEQLDQRKSKKLQEVAGFCEIILRYVSGYLGKADAVNVLECSCGKSYLGFVLAILLPEMVGKKTTLVGVDTNPDLIERCEILAGDLHLQNTSFKCSRTLNFESDREFNLVVALHACDTATDEAIAKGIGLNARLVMVVPCCQNQIRGQLKSGHPLTPMTDFGPVRYRFANLLTDVLRSQFLQAAGYHVELDEIGSPRLTPKNLCIAARRVLRRSKKPRDREYVALRDMFGVKPAVERFCPDVLS
jgi:hypothetical protein